MFKVLQVYECIVIWGIQGLQYFGMFSILYEWEEIVGYVIYRDFQKILIRCEGKKSFCVEIV